MSTTTVFAAQAGGVTIDADATFGEDLLGRFQGPFRQSIHGEFTGDLREDVLVMSGNRPFWVTSPGIYRSLRKHPRTANDFAVLPGAGERSNDAVLMVSQRENLELWSFNEVAGDVVVESVGSGLWAGALEIDVYDSDADGLWEAVGWQGGAQTRFVRLEDPRNGTEEIHDVDYDVYRMLPIEWDDADLDGQELLVSTSEGIKVLDGDWNELTSFSTTEIALQIEVLHNEIGRLTQRFVALYDDPVLGRVLRTSGPEGSELPAVFPVIGVVAMVAGDLDGDGDDDLLMSQQLTRQLLHLTHQASDGSSPTFDFNDFFVFDPTGDGSGGTAAPDNQSWPIYADMDDDGDSDVLFGVEHEKQLAFVRNPTFEHRDAMPLATSVELLFNSRLANGQLTLKLAAPVAAPAADEALEVVVWRQNAAGLATSKYGVEYQLLPLTGAWPMDVSVDVPGVFGAPQMYHVEVRMVDVDTGGKPVLAGPAYSYGFASNVNSYVSLIEDPAVDPAAALFAKFVETNVLPGSSDYTFDSPLSLDFGDAEPVELGAWVVPMPNVPCFQNGFPNKYGIPQ